MKEINVKVVSDVVCNNLFRKINFDDNYKLKMVFSPVDQIIPEIINCADEDFLLLHISQYAFNSYVINKDFLEAMCQVFSHLEDLLKRSQVKIILNTVYFNCGSFSQAELISKKKLISTFEQLLLDFTLRHPSECVVVDVATLVANCGFSNNISFRNYGVMRYPYSKLIGTEISNEYMFHFKSYFNPRKKVIFVDADNTLWGGVVGEDGIGGIKVGHEYPGSMFRFFQLTLLRLKNSGVLLCLVTKNNIADVEEAFFKRDMPLSLSDFVAVKSNWERKSGNIQQLLRLLNIGASSAIFIDDNPFEIEEVGRAHPDLLCLKFHINDFSDINNELFKLSSLYEHNLTVEDTFKADSYFQEEKRKDFLDKSNSLENYLRDLSIKMTVHLNDMSLVSRVSQLTQKTNQFNLTTKRYSISEIEMFMKNNDVYAFSVEDKFGSMGVVGVVIVVDNMVDSLLLSCRAFGREIEKAMILAVSVHVDKFPLYSQYRPTQKNDMTKDFYTKNGFHEQDIDNSTVIYRLNKKMASSIGHIQEVIWN